MSIGEAWWFVDSGSGWSPRRLLGFLAGQGIVHDHPDAGHVWVWGDDGCRSASTLDSVDRAWASQEQIAFQLWLDSDHDVFVLMRPGCSRIEFKLDGLAMEQVEKVVSCLLLGAVLEKACQAVVVDRYLPDTGEEWVDAVSDARPPPYEPDLLLRLRPDGEPSVALSAGSWLLDHPGDERG